ncbi:hypothetical protein Poly30_30660 [Planctomycetes bacterium Poly30]|uniref:Carbohydrate binding domain protein n=1 Tax=Saltatorellus ferox TaxID=2528018 RepID=A0A518ETX9_9BACT|nr:hypothetical protein Poly30_30660 [Planctomycetes bacterium Poly30]
MNKTLLTTLAGFLASASLNAAMAAPQTNLAVNGDFELGDTSSWVSFPTPNSTFDVTMDANTGTFAGTVFNDDQASAAVIKQANLGAGVVATGDVVTITFSAKGSGAAGGVVFAEFFSEIAGGGVSSSEILSGAPLPLTGSYQTFTFTATAGSDVSGGVTLQFAVVTGANIGSTSELFVDDVSVSVPGGATNYCTAAPNSTGATGVMSASGSFVAADNSLTLTASDLPTNAFGFFITSMTQGFVANPAGSAGNLCVAGAIGRFVFPGQTQSSGAGGSFSLTPDLGQIPTGTVIVPALPGQTWNFQAWHRDAVGGMTTSNFTDGLSLTFQ